MTVAELLKRLTGAIDRKELDPYAEVYKGAPGARFADKVGDRVTEIDLSTRAVKMVVLR